MTAVQTPGSDWEHVVEVAADLVLAAGGAVARHELQPGISGSRSGSRLVWSVWAMWADSAYRRAFSRCSAAREASDSTSSMSASAGRRPDSSP
jgi:hypothetical protein